MISHCIPEYMPGCVPIAFDGGGTFYLIDMREPAVDREYPILFGHAGSARLRLRDLSRSDLGAALSDPRPPHETPAAEEAERAKSDRRRSPDHGQGGVGQ